MTALRYLRGFLFGLLLPISFVALSPPAIAASGEVVPLSVEELLKAPTLAAYSPASFSPDHRLLAYVVTDNGRRLHAIDTHEVLRNGFGWYGVAGDIWVTDLSTGERRNVTGGVGHNWLPSWSPDSRRLAFLADRSAGPALGPARLWIWERATNKLHPVGSADVRDGYVGLTWSDDGRSVVVALIPGDLGREGYAASMEGKGAGAPGAAVSAGVTAKVFEFDPSGPSAVPMTDQVNLDLWKRDLGVVNVETGELRPLVQGSRIGQYVVSPDHRRLACSVLKGSEKPGAGQYLYDLVVQELAGGAPRTVASSQRLSYSPAFSFSPSGDRLAWRTGGPLAEDEIHVVPVAGGPSRRLSQGVHYKDKGDEGEPPVWDPTGENLFFTRDGALWRAAADGSHPAAEFASVKGSELGILAPGRQILFSPDRRSAILVSTDSGTKKIGFVRIDLRSGAVSPIFSEDKHYGGYGTEPSISPDGSSIAYVAEDALHPPDLVVRSGDLTQARTVSEVAPALANRTFGRAEMIEWRNVDGETLRGALVYPAGYEPGKRYPLIVKVYGGSSISNDRNRFGFASAAVENLQIYAMRGYAVLLADSKLNLATPMTDLMKSVLPGIDRAIDSGLADPERVGVTGHSYGGYSTISLIAQSPRFRAAVMRAGMADLIGIYGQLEPDGTNYGLAWAESGQGRMGGSPWEVRDRYLENSPFFHLDRVKTPLLIIHGGSDDAVPSYLADQIFTGLRRLGKTVTYARYGGEAHWEGTWSQANQLDALTRSIAWFDRYLKAPDQPAANKGASKTGP
jgi:dipeptidyl aminopeptidase/acylaminoacyl peptidase